MSARAGLKQQIKQRVGQHRIDRVRSYQRRIQGLYLGLGDKVRCPICERSYQKFLRYAGRDNQRCPWCQSLPRQRLLYLFLRDEMKLFEGESRILHFAPELCLASEIRKHPRLQYLTADLLASFDPYLCVAPDHVMSVTEIGFADHEFDIVLCNHVLEHVRDDARAMKEILRVLRPGGYAILQVPIDHSAEATHEDPTFGPEERAWHYGFVDHVRLYGMDYKDRLAAVGFEVDVNWYVRKLDAARLALDPDEEIFVCYKPLRHRMT